MTHKKRIMRRRLPPRRRRRVFTIHVLNGKAVNPLPDTETPFLGELMTCVLCGKQGRSDPRVESNWRAMRLEETGPWYACPDEFPPDDASREEFKEAYLRFVMAAVKKRIELEKEQAQ